MLGIPRCLESLKEARLTANGLEPRELDEYCLEDRFIIFDF